MQCNVNRTIEPFRWWVGWCDGWWLGYDATVYFDVWCDVVDVRTRTFYAKNVLKVTQCFSFGWLSPCGVCLSIRINPPCKSVELNTVDCTALVCSLTTGTADWWVLCHSNAQVTQMWTLGKQCQQHRQNRGWNGANDGTINNTGRRKWLQHDSSIKFYSNAKHFWIKLFYCN